MKLSEKTLEEYAKKILGFAYQKTGNSYAMVSGFDMFAHLIKESKEGGKCNLEIPSEEDGKHVMTWVVVK